jgi:hypothetical protein
MTSTRQQAPYDEDSALLVVFRHESCRALPGICWLPLSTAGQSRNFSLDRLDEPVAMVSTENYTI